MEVIGLEELPILGYHVVTLANPKPPQEKKPDLVVTWWASRRCSSYLEEADEVAQHHSVDPGQGVDDGDGGLGVLVVGDALLIKLVWDQGLLQLAVPQLQQRCCKKTQRRKEDVRSLIWSFCPTKHCPEVLPGTCGSSKPVGIFHWSTCSLRALTSSMSPGTLWRGRGVSDQVTNGDLLSQQLWVLQENQQGTSAGHGARPHHDWWSPCRNLHGLGGILGAWCHQDPGMTLVATVE